jgi:hypothetical protein
MKKIVRELLKKWADIRREHLLSHDKEDSLKEALKRTKIYDE